MLNSNAIQALVVKALEDLKATDITTLDVRDLTSVTDIMVIASGGSDRQVKALSDKVVEQAKAHGVTVMGVEGQEAAEWVLIDLLDVIVHVMLPRVRDFYQLERLWDRSHQGREAGAPRQLAEH